MPRAPPVITTVLSAMSMRFIVLVLRVAGRIQGFEPGAQSRTASGTMLRTSGHVLPAVDGEGRSGDEAGLVGGQEEHAAGDLLGFSETADGNERQDLGLQNLFGNRLHHFGGDIA